MFVLASFFFFRGGGTGAGLFSVCLLAWFFCCYFLPPLPQLFWSGRFPFLSVWTFLLVKPCWALLLTERKHRKPLSFHRALSRYGAAGSGPVSPRPGLGGCWHLAGARGPAGGGAHREVALWRETASPPGAAGPRGKACVLIHGLLGYRSQAAFALFPTPSVCWDCWETASVTSAISILCWFFLHVELQLYPRGLCGINGPYTPVSSELCLREAFLWKIM